jgi:hypothetical protein
VLHRIDELERVPGPRFFAYCYRLTAYHGVVAGAFQRQQAQRAKRAAAPPMSLAEWAAAHPAAIEAAHQRMSEGR